MNTNLYGLHPQLNELGIRKLDFELPESGVLQKEYLSYIISDKHPDFKQVLTEIDLIIDKLKADKLSAI